MLPARFITACLSLLLALCAACDSLPGAADPPTIPPAPNVDGESARVTSVIDGDTIEVEMNGRLYRVRYIGINAPERDEPCYAEASSANRALVGGQTVTLVRDVQNTDPFGRLLRYVYAGERFVNAELVARGVAEAVEYPPDTRFTAMFRELEVAAREAGAGCHPTGIFDDNSLVR